MPKLQKEPRCSDCNNDQCYRSGYATLPLPYCDKQPVVDRYEKAIQQNFFSPKCRTCRHGFVEVRLGPCSRCVHNAN